jgi:hypothetical protein
MKVEIEFEVLCGSCMFRHKFTEQKTGTLILYGECLHVDLRLVNEVGSV